MGRLRQAALRFAGPGAQVSGALHAPRAISNSRLLSMDQREVRFAYRDRKDANRRRTMALPGAEFLRRFLLHLLPRSFVRIRYYGLLANRCRAQQVVTARALLAAARPALPAHPAPTATEAAPAPSSSCPHCGGRRLRIVAEMMPADVGPLRATAVWPYRDTS